MLISEVSLIRFLDLEYLTTQQLHMQLRQDWFSDLNNLDLTDIEGLINR
jgi:hypothetical protein